MRETHRRPVCLLSRTVVLNGAGAVDRRHRRRLITLRDSKNQQAPVLAFSRSEIAALSGGTKKTEFDHLPN